MYHTSFKPWRRLRGLPWRFSEWGRRSPKNSVALTSCTFHRKKKKKKLRFCSLSYAKPWITRTINLFFFFKLFFSINFIFHKLKKKKRIFFFYRLDRFQLSEMISNSVSRKVTSLHRAIKVFLNEFFLVHFIERVLCLFNYNVKDILNIHVYVYIFTKRKGNYSINIHLCRARINVK